MIKITKENLTVVIVTLKSEEVIDKCLQSIPSDVKKLVIENSSNHKFTNSIEKKYKNIKTYLTNENLGMGTANNIGISKTKTKYVMVLNPDTELKKDTLSKIFEISNNLNFAILSPICEDKNFPNYKIFSKKNEVKNSDLFEVDRVDGYAMILNKSKFENFFDEKFFMYLENDDLCLRIKKKGEKILIYKKSTIKHLGSKAVNQKYYYELESSRNWHWNWSKFYFRKKHYGFAFAFIFGFPSFLKSCTKSLFFYLIGKNNEYKKYKNRAAGFLNSMLNKPSWYRPKFD